MENNIKKTKGRPKGSQNKPKILTKNNSSVISIKMEKQVESAPKTQNSNRGWINWGSRNMYPLDLSNLYYNSVTHRACCEFAATAILGDGVDYEKMKIMGQEELMPNYNETWDDLIYNLALDYVIYGSYAIQIIKNKDDKTYSFYHQPIGDVRCSPKNEDGDIETYWISSDWSALQKYPPVELKSFAFNEDDEITSGEPYLFVYNHYTPDLEYYWQPQYTSGIKAIQTEIELLRYDLRSVMNNFSASGVLTMNRIDDDEERKMVLENIESMFQGSDNANSLMITFKNNDEENPVTFTKFDKDVNNVNLFESNNERTIAKIIAAHRIPSKQLIGFSSENAMLGGTGNELNVAYNLYNKTVANKNRRAIVSTINKMFKLNDVDVEVVLKPLSFSVLEPTQIIDRDESITEETEETYDNKNLEEKQTEFN